MKKVLDNNYFVLQSNLTQLKDIEMYDELLAFPNAKSRGMMLRDYFAAKAMNALAVGTLQASKGNLKLLAENSYAIADAMMEARNVAQ